MPVKMFLALAIAFSTTMLRGKKRHGGRHKRK